MFPNFSMFVCSMFQNPMLFGLLCLSLAGGSLAGGRGLLLGGQVCNLAAPCPTGRTCAYTDNGVKICVRRSETDVAPVNDARCPLPGETWSTQGGGWWRKKVCSFDSDCASGYRCCSKQGAKFRQCYLSTAIDPTPAVTELVTGAVGIDQAAIGIFEFPATLSLVQSNGFNVIFDAGGLVDRIRLLDALADKAGLYPENIDLVVISHGHMDHIGNAALFSDIPHIVDGFVVEGDQFTANPLRSQDLYDPSADPYLINGDANLEVIPTPGHTLQDVSLIVRNTAIGTIALVGDIILNEAEAALTEVSAAGGYQDPDSANISRPTLICMADYIVPGHGPMFQVTAELKTAYACR